eukprot:TRINITY_DN31004_c0_g1_i1.p1 TRINITY_DN31004_c0_g1~~TRINITY_DN31004_c0_g1_i1.p1  ORF type:complete len:448 (-),score=82.58 TRINITY_DN31004_c0_g1_i1:140-1483(-)
MDRMSAVNGVHGHQRHSCSRVVLLWSLAHLFVVDARTIRKTNGHSAEAAVQSKHPGAQQLSLRGSEELPGMGAVFLGLADSTADHDDDSKLVTVSANEDAPAEAQKPQMKLLAIAAGFFAIPVLLWMLGAPIAALVFGLYIALYMSWSMLTYASRGGKHNSALTVLGATIIKLALSFFLWRIWEGASFSLLPAAVWKHRHTLAQYVVPAGLYAAGDVLRVHALRATDNGTFAVLFNSRLLFLALVWQWAMDRKLLALHWASLMAILVGCVLKEWPHASFGGEASARHWAYVEIIVLGTMTAMAAVWNERLLQTRTDAGVALQNLAMYSWGLFWTTVIGLLWNYFDPAANANPFSVGSWSHVWSEPLVIGQVVLLACYGVTTAYFLRYLSNIAREVALGVFIVLSVMMDVLIFHKSPYAIECGGVLLVMLGIALFCWQPVLPKKAPEK